MENLHDYYSTDGSCIHTQDQRGLYIIYDVALKDLEELEQHLLLTASHFIQRSGGQAEALVCRSLAYACFYDDLFCNARCNKQNVKRKVQ